MISNTYFSFRIFVKYSCSPEVISDVNRMIEFLRKRGYTGVLYYKCSRQSPKKLV